MKLKVKSNNYQSFVVMRYLGLSANKANDFRREVAKLGGNVEVDAQARVDQSGGSCGVNLDLACATRPYWLGVR